MNAESVVEYAHLDLAIFTVIFPLDAEVTTVLDASSLFKARQTNHDSG